MSFDDVAMEIGEGGGDLREETKTVGAGNFDGGVLVLVRTGLGRYGM